MKIPFALITEAVDELSRRKLRTGLTLLGMLFGVASIVAMLAIGEGSRREALRLVSELGLQNLIIESKKLSNEQLKEIRTRSLGLSSDDGNAALLAVPGAESVALRTEIKTDQIVYGQKVETGHTFAVTEAYAQQSGLQTGAGRWFEASDFATQAAVAVIGPRIATQLFGNADPVGELIRVNNVWLQVVGVLADRAKGKSEFEGIKLGLDDERIFVPWDSAKMRFSLRELEDEVSSLSLRLRVGTSPEAAARVLQRLIDARHNGADDTTLIVPMGLYRQNQQTQKIFTIVMSSIAAVSLLVGGIGIMNIMLANVLERKKEIGLKRALGATQRDIVRQFLAEALVISGMGALLGLLAGIAAAYSIAALASWSVAWSPLTLIIAVSACVATGLGFGVFPARQAAQLDPIAALRSE